MQVIGGSFIRNFGLFLEHFQIFKVLLPVFVSRIYLLIFLKNINLFQAWFLLNLLSNVGL